MVETKTSSDHPASMAERISRRLRNSGEGAGPDITTKTGDSPQRVFHNIHSGGTAKQHGAGERGTDIHGNKRGTV